MPPSDAAVYRCQDRSTSLRSLPGRASQFFPGKALAGIASRALTDARVWTYSRLLAWVLMPDHWHGLIELGETEHLHVLVGRLKTNSARCLRVDTEGLDRVWARAFHDRALRHDDDLLSAARYGVMNPVRASLVTRAGNYPYWNAIWL